MKKILIMALSLACLSAVLLQACKKNKTNDLSYGLSPVNDPDLVNKSLRLPGKLTEGSLPPSNVSGSGIRITNWPAAIEVNAGVDVYIPYVTSNDKQAAHLFVQVEGAHSFWDIPVTEDMQPGGLFMKVFIPPFVQEDTFNLVFAIADKDGKVSAASRTNTIVSSPLDCGATAQGSVGITVLKVDLGDKAGLVSVYYNTYSIPDRVDLLYNGNWLRSTGIFFPGYHPTCSNYSQGANAGFVSGQGVLKFDYDPAKNRYLDVYVTGCDNSTLWDIQVNCPADKAKWYDRLPDCPCNYLEAKALGKTTYPNGEWEDYGDADQDFHYGATYEVRWIPETGGAPGQQCTYNKDYMLITHGIAAGSVDSVSPQNYGVYLCSHYRADIIPWGTINPTWAITCSNDNIKPVPCWQYMLMRPANKGLACKEVRISDIEHMKVMIGDMTCEEATLLIRKASESPFIDRDLKNFILGYGTTLKNNEIKARLKSWMDTNMCSTYPGDKLCIVLNKALNNL